MAGHCGTFRLNPNYTLEGIQILDLHGLYIMHYNVMDLQAAPRNVSKLKTAKQQKLHQNTFRQAQSSYLVSSTASSSSEFLWSSIVFS